VIFVVGKATPKQHAALSKKQKAMASAKNEHKDRSAQWEKDKAEKLNPLLQQIQPKSKKIVLVKNMRITRTKSLS
jgi:hypothetical protein